MVACLAYPEEFMQDDVIAPFLLLSIVTLPQPIHTVYRKIVLHILFLE